MPTPTYTALATRTLTGSAATVTFSSIPATYRDLIIVSNLLNTTDATDGTIYFNGDTTAGNYTRVFMYNLAGQPTPLSSTGNNQSIIPRIAVGSLVVHIMDYSATDKHKTTLLTSNQAAFISYTQASRWANTAAVNTIRFAPNSGSFATGCTFSLYGVIA
jgi:hypothetical protein